MKRPNVTLIIGNHEWMMYNALKGDKEHLRNWYAPCNGGRITHKGLSDAVDNNEITFDEIINFIGNSPLFMDFGDYYLVHGYPHFTVYDYDDYDDYRPYGLLEQPYFLTLNEALDEFNIRLVESVVWDSVFYTPWLYECLRDTRVLPTTIYSGHAIKDNAIFMECDDFDLPLYDSIPNIKCIDIDGGCAFPETSNQGHLNLLNLSKNTCQQIAIYNEN